MNKQRSSIAGSRRRFLGGVLTASAATSLSALKHSRAAESPVPPAAPPPGRRIKLGLIGCGGRGSWLGDLFVKHGGYEIRAVADYFPERAEKGGEKFGVDPARRFSGLGAYKKILDSGVEAVTVVNVPHFHPLHARAAIEAGLHVYAAKPVAVDVPGALSVQETGRLATQKKLCHLVDYQMGTDPVNIEVVSLYDQGAIRNIATFHRAICEGLTDNPTVQQAGDDVLTAVLGREACTRGGTVTMESILKENKSLPFDLTGLQS